MLTMFGEKQAMTESKTESMAESKIESKISGFESTLYVPHLPIVGSWQNLALVIFLGWVVFNLFTLYSSLQQMPSPLYGGDVYYHFGVMADGDQSPFL